MFNMDPRHDKHMPIHRRIPTEKRHKLIILINRLMTRPRISRQKLADEAPTRSDSLLYAFRSMGIRVAVISK
jgi:hypothetical protein